MGMMEYVEEWVIDMRVRELSEGSIAVNRTLIQYYLNYSNSKKADFWLYNRVFRLKRVGLFQQGCNAHRAHGQRRREVKSPLEWDFWRVATSHNHKPQGAFGNSVSEKAVLRE